MIEIWKDIQGFDNDYQVSNLGRIYSRKTNMILNPHIHKDGYARLTLRQNNKKISCTVHRLVALAFIENKENKKCVNHKDENRSNNISSNLEWCTHQENSLYGSAIEKRIKHTNFEAKANKCKIKVAQYDLQGNFIKTWNSATDCYKTYGFSNCAIARCCKGKLKSAYGYTWKYA